MPLVPSAHFYPLRRFVQIVLRPCLLVACVLLCMSGVSAGQRVANEMSSEQSADTALPRVTDLATLGDDPPGTTKDPRAQNQVADGGVGASYSDQVSDLRSYVEGLQRQRAAGLTAGGAAPSVLAHRSFDSGRK